MENGDGARNGLSFPFHVHDSDEFVTAHIRKTRRVLCPAELVSEIQSGVHRAHRSGGSFVFLDVGANLGSCAVLAGLLGARVFAFEPLNGVLYNARTIKWCFI